MFLLPLGKFYSENMNLKNFSLRLVGLAIVACCLSACQQKAATPETGAATATTPAAANAGGGTKIVFVYADTLLSKYEDFSAKQAELEKRQQQAESRIQSRMKALESEVMAIQGKVQEMAPNQLAAEQERIGRKEQEIVKERDRLGQSLLEETQRLNKELEEKVNAVLKAVQQEFGYDFILSYGPGTGVLMVNDSLDITDEVVKRLNAPKEN